MKQVGYWALFSRNRNFRKLFLARLVSLLGDWFNTLAVLAVLRDLGALSASSFGWVLILKMLPALLFSAPAGVAADRLPRRLILVVADLARALLVLAMLGLYFIREPALLYLLVAMQAAVSAFFEPAKQAMLPDIVTPEELTAANALSAATWSAMLTIGAALGGLVTALVGWELALVVDALTYLVSLLLLLGIAEPARALARRDGVPRLQRLLGLSDVAEGLAYLRRRPRVLSLVLVKTGWSIGGALFLVITVLGEQRFPVAGEALLGVSLLYIARGLGTGAGPFLSRWLSQSQEAAMERFILYGILCGVVFYVWLGFVDNPLTAAVVVGLAHLGGATVWVFSTIRLQQLVPSEVRGRVFATEQALFTLTYALSTFAYGALLDSNWLPVRYVPSLLGALWLLPAALWALRGLKLGWAGAAARREGAL